MKLDPLIWGPHYWFFLHTTAISYPIYPNSTIKKKYYNFIQSLPLFLPDKEISNTFSKLLDEYPVTPYLDSRESFIKWMHFIHNKVNIYLNKPILSYNDSLIQYYNNYKPKKIIKKEELKLRDKLIFFSIFIILIMLIIILNYNI